MQAPCMSALLAVRSRCALLLLSADVKQLLRLSQFLRKHCHFPLLVTSRAAQQSAPPEYDSNPPIRWHCSATASDVAT